MTTASSPTSAPAAIILAAGKGTRMGSERAKVLHEVAGEPMVRWVTRACFDAGVGQCIIVVGHQADEVRAALADEPRCVFVEQTQQLGTAHAAEQARPIFDQSPTDDVFVLAGDGPLIRSETLRKLLEVHRQQKAAATLATALLDDPSGYGRVLRTAENGFDRIVEQKDASPEQLEVREVNPSYYCFDRALLFEALKNVGNDNRQGEFYLTDVPGLLRDQGHVVTLVDAVPAEDVLSINTPQQLAEVDRILRQRLDNQPAASSTGASR